MAAQQTSKAQVEILGMAAGEANSFSGCAQEKALAELLLVRCGVTGLVGSQVIDQAKLCGQAVRAAFDELNKVSEQQE